MGNYAIYHASDPTPPWEKKTLNLDDSRKLHMFAGNRQNLLKSDKLVSTLKHDSSMVL